MLPNKTPISNKESDTGSQSIPLPPPSFFIIFTQFLLSLASYVGDTTGFTCVFIREVLKDGITLLRKPLAVLVFFYFLVFLAGQAFDSAFHVPFDAVSHSLCESPILQRTSLCHFVAPDSIQSGSSPRNADFPGLVKAEAQTFESLLDQANGGSELSLKLKKAEYAISDLVIMIRFSNLGNKDLLADAVAKFCLDARGTAKVLQSFSSKVHGSVDQILAYNIHALSTMSAPRPPSISSAIRPFYTHPDSEEIAVQAFEEVMAVLVDKAARLILIANSLLAHLETLEEQLDFIHDLVFQEEFVTSAAKDELLLRLWTKLGGNQQAVRNYDGNLKLLKGLGEYRRKAKAYVASALQTLHALSDDLDDMRQRMSNPDLARIPIEVQIQSIGYGIQRLRNSMNQAKQRVEPEVALA